MWGSDTHPLSAKIDLLDRLLSEAGTYGMKLIAYDDEDKFTTVDGLSFWKQAVYSNKWYDPDKELPDVEGYHNCVIVTETRLKVFQDGRWLETGPWEQLADKAIDKSIRKLKRMISVEEKRREQVKAAQSDAAIKAHGDLVAQSRALFGGQS